ncbi:MAG: hypothetical protein H7039_24970 [Bryobacteraceae bacterium]|nr:hypothetical protein [Bryobacteraceae bacterium]
MFVYLLRDYEILYAGQQRLSLSQVHTQCFHRQLPSLHDQHVPTLFRAVRFYAYDLDPDTNDWNLRLCANAFNRVLAS